MQKTSAQSGKRSSLFLNSFSCTPRQGLFLHLASYKIHPSSLVYRLPALYHKLFTAEVWVNLTHTGNKMLLSRGCVFRASRRLHAPVSSSCSACPFSPCLSFFFFSFFSFHLPPIFLQVSRLLMVPQHASTVLWGRSVPLHSSVTAFCSTKDVTIACCAVQATSEEDRKIQGEERERWNLLLLH